MMSGHESSADKRDLLASAIQHWGSLADEAERRAALELLHPNVARAQADLYRRTVRALEIQRDTGVAVCPCCHKPLGDDKPYWMRGAS